MNRRGFLRASAAASSLIGLAGCQPQKRTSINGRFTSGRLPKYGQLKVGAARRVVNPTKPAVPIGHMINKPVSEPVYSDICTTALVLEDHTGKRLAWISCDFMQMPYEVADPIKALIEKNYGIDPTAICVHATHNHASPPIIAREVTRPEYFDQQYADFFVKQTVDVVGDAIAKLTAAKLRYCEDVCSSVAINRRRKKPDGKVLRAISPYNKGIVDFKVQVVVAESIEDRKPIVILGEYASHPVVTMNKYLGGEYPSYFRKHVEDKFPGSIAIFFQGCAGNIRIQVLNEDRTGWIAGTPKDAERFGFDLADAVERAIAKKQDSVQPSQPLRRSRLERALTNPGAPIVGPIEAEYAVIDVPINRKIAPAAPETITFRIQAFRLGSKSKTPFTLVALGAEAFIEYSLNLEKRLKPSNTIVIGYANDMRGYLPTAKAYDEGGYEPNSWREYWYALPGPYSPEVESIVLDAATKLARPKKRRII